MSKPPESYQYHRSPCHHLAIYLILYYYLPQVYRSTRRQNPQKHTNTTGHHVTTSPYILFSTTTYYRSTGQHVVKTLRSIPIPQVTMSPPRHISYSPLLPTTGLQVNTSSKPSEAYQYHRSPCHHLAIYLNLFYYLLQVYRLTRCQNPQNHTNTTGHHVTTSPYILFSTTTYHRSTGQHVVKPPRINPLLQVTMSPPRHISYSLLLPTTGLQGQHVVKPLRSIPVLQVTMSPPHHVSHSLLLPTTGLHVVKTLTNIPLLQVTMSPPHHISVSLLLPTTGLQVNMSSKPSDAYQYYRSPCHHLTMYLILYYHLLQVWWIKDLINEWMKEGMNEIINNRMYGSINTTIHEWMNGRMKVPRNKWINRQTSEFLKNGNKWMNKEINKRTHERKNERISW